MLRPLLILFAKAPIPGRAKTRLCPPLTLTEACALHAAFVMDTGNMLLTLAAAADVELCTDLSTEAWASLVCPRSTQFAGDLGERLFHALERGLFRREVAMVLGSDSPGLPSSHVTALLRSKADVTLGPTPDGGFYAIACRAVSQNMFERVRWSTAHTLDDVVAAASKCGLTVEIGPAWFDIDVEADLLQLCGMPDLPLNTAEWLQRYREQSWESPG